MPRALFFDAAGTLIRPAESVAATYARLLAAHGHAVVAAELGPAFAKAFAAAGLPDYAAHAEGDAAERAWWRKVVNATLAAEVDDDAFLALFDHYAQPEAWTVFPETREVLEEAAASGFRLAVVSNFDLRLHPILEGLGLARFFDVIVTSADAKARKPDPAIFHRALESLDLAAGDVLHVGDSPEADLEGAAACGIEAFLLRRPDNDLRDFLACARKPADDR